MPVQFRCRGCEARLKAPDAARGKVMTCKQCGSKNRVPGGKARKKKAPRKKKAAADDEDFLAGVDLDRMEDTSIRVCQNCSHQFPADESVCPSCGLDNDATAGLGREQLQKEVKRAERDPSEFFNVARSESWEFYTKHVPLAMRSGLYMGLFSTLAFASSLMTMYVSRTPLTVFWGFVTFILLTVPPGWLWFLNREIIQATMEKKPELKRVKFDFFECSMLGINFLAWQMVMLIPIVPLVIGAMLVGQDSGIVGSIVGSMGYLVIAPLVPVAMAHFAMPVSWPGWILPKVVGGFFKTAPATLFVVLFAVLLLIPASVGTAVTGAVFGEDIADVVEDIQEDSQRRREQYLASKGKDDDEGGDDVPVEGAGEAGDDETSEKKDIDFTLLVVPAIVYFVVNFYVGLVMLYPMRMNGWLAYYYRKPLGLIRQEKQLEYKARERKVDEDGNIIVKGRMGPPKWLTGIGGTILFYVVLNVVVFFGSGGKYVVLPRPIAIALNLVAESQD